MQQKKCMFQRVGKMELNYLLFSTLKFLLYDTLEKKTILGKKGWEDG